MSDSIRQNPIIKAALTPLSWLYGGATDLRNLAYDKAWLASGKPHCKTLSVGNLTVGGTGKTPMIEYLIRLLAGTHTTAVISRGYGRKTKGLVVADAKSTADDIGDEPLQFFRKFDPEVKVLVAEKRAVAVEKIKQDFPQINLLLLDDGYQHRSLNRDADLLLTDYHRLFYEDLPFPAGNLRERRTGARRARVVIVTKCPPGLTDAERSLIRSRIARFTRPGTPVFFSSVAYGEPTPFRGSGKLQDHATRVGMSGLAQNAPFEAFARQEYQISEFTGFPDHHRYTTADLKLVLNQGQALITTEKDMVKLLPLATALPVAERCFYVPIEVRLEDQGRFENLLKEILEV